MVSSWSERVHGTLQHDVNSRLMRVLVERVPRTAGDGDRGTHTCIKCRPLLPCIRDRFNVIVSSFDLSFNIYRSIIRSFDNRSIYRPIDRSIHISVRYGESRHYNAIRFVFSSMRRWRELDGMWLRRKPPAGHVQMAFECRVIMGNFLLLVMTWYDGEPPRVSSIRDQYPRVVFACNGFIDVTIEPRM